MYLSATKSMKARKLRINMNGSDLGFKWEIIGWLICISCHLNPHMCSNCIYSLVQVQIQGGAGGHDPPNGTSLYCKNLCSEMCHMS